MIALVLKWVVVALAGMNFGFMLFDGMRALMNGDYIRPKSGKYAGQLGPWSKLVQKLGIDPESILMKAIFVFWGITGLIITLLFMIGFSWSWEVMMIATIMSLWYLLAGTATSIIQIILLIIIRMISG